MIVKRDKNLTTEQFLIMMHGLTGTGKSTVARLISKVFSEFVVFHTAIIRKNLNLTPQNLKNAGISFEFRLDDPIFTLIVSRKVYHHMINKARRAIKNERSVVLDGSFCISWERKLVYDLVRELKINFCILHCDCSSEDIIRERIVKREKDESSFSEASSWNTYLSLRDNSEPLIRDFGEIDFPFWMIIYDTYKNGIEIKTFGKSLWTKPLPNFLMTLTNILKKNKI